jgi:hypothetical protein
VYTCFKKRANIHSYKDLELESERNITPRSTITIQKRRKEERGEKLCTGKTGTDGDA